MTMQWQIGGRSCDIVMLQNAAQKCANDKNLCADQDCKRYSTNYRERQNHVTHETTGDPSLPAADSIAGAERIWIPKVEGCHQDGCADYEPFYSEGYC